jgi:glucose-1-phosphate thymidylyltransferase
MLAGIRDILIVSTPEALPVFRTLLGDGTQWGLQFSYAEQDKPRGIADVFIVGEEFVADETVCLILGDNIFFGHGLPDQLKKAAELEHGALIFAYPVRNPEVYGVVEFDENGTVLSIEEKPEVPRSRYAIPGVYFYDGQVVRMAKGLRPSARGELEITDLNRAYMELKQLRVEKLGRGVAWMDAGAHRSLLEASNFVQALQERQGLRISCPEEIAYRYAYISAEQLEQIIPAIRDNDYCEYLLGLIEQGLPSD